MDKPTAYPLSWPMFRKRAAWRKAGPYKADGNAITLGGALKRVKEEVGRLGGIELLISTNLKPQDWMTGQQPSLRDPGVAIYFTTDDGPIVLACDTFDDLSQNLAGLAAHMEAARRMDRIGVQTAIETLRGYALLPAAGPAWHVVLGVAAHASADEIQAAWRAKARDNHPDRPGGSEARMAEINSARDEGLKQASKRAGVRA